MHSGFYISTDKELNLSKFSTNGFLQWAAGSIMYHGEYKSLFLSENKNDEGNIVFVLSCWSESI